MTKSFSSTEKFIEHLCYVALCILKENGGKMRLSDLRDAVEKREGRSIPAELKSPIRANSRVLGWHDRMSATAPMLTNPVNGYLNRMLVAWELTPKGAKALARFKKEEDFLEDARLRHNAEMKRRKKEGKSIKR